jgi:hypothetical protein
MALPRQLRTEWSQAGPPQGNSWPVSRRNRLHCTRLPVGHADPGAWLGIGTFGH